jgi:hypothetical protein
LFRATSKPTIKNIIKGGANKAGSILIEEPITEVYQGYSLEKAKGTNKSLVDYAFFDKEGFNNLVGGFAGGLGTSAVTNAMGIAKNALSWNRLYNVSTADMQNAVRYAGVTQMVATPSEMQNSINLDLLKSAQSISQEEYQKIPNNERAQKEKAKNEYVNRTVAYVYGKSINNSVQNGLNIEDVHEHYKAHNEAISKAYSTLAELANETNKPMYKKQADYYASLAQKSEIGQQTPIYSLITPKGRVFISEQTAKTLGEGSIQQKNDSFAKAVRAGDIIGVQVVDDSQTAQSLIKKFDDAKLSQQLAVQQSQGGATEVGQPNQTNVQTPIEGTTEIPTTKGVIDKPNISPESNPALRDVESVAKALRENEEKGGKPIPTTLIPKQEFEVLNNGNRGLNDIIAETYHKAKAKPENTRTEQEQELVKAVESLLSKEQTPAALSRQDAEYINKRKTELQNQKELVDIFKAAKEKAKNDDELVDLLIDSGKINEINEFQGNLISGTSITYGSLLHDGKYAEVLADISKSESLLSNEQPISTTQSGSNPALRDVESVAKELEAKKADIEIGKVNNTEYEVKADGVYYQNKKLDNPENKTHSKLIIADIEKRKGAELKRPYDKLQQNINDINEIASFGNTFSEALDNIQKRIEELSKPLNKRQLEENKDKVVKQWDKDVLEKQPEYIEIKRLRKLIEEKINGVYGEAYGFHSKEGLQKAIEEENKELNDAPVRRKTADAKINAKYDAELKALEQQPISTTQSGSNPALSKTEVLKKKIDESVEYKMEKFTRNNNADIKAILILQNDGVTHIDVDKKLNDSLIDKYKNLADKAHSEGNHDLGDAYQQAIAIIAEGAESTSIRFKKGTENEIDYELSKDSANKKLKRNEDAKAKMKADELESLLSQKQSTSTTQSESNPALSDVESTAKALETESKNKPTIWEQVKQLVKGAVKKVGDKLGIISNEQHLSNFEKAKQEWDKLSPRDKKLKRADYELDDLEHTEGGYYKVGNSLIDLDLNTNHFKLLLENSKFLNILNKLGVTKIHSENRPAGEMFAHYSDGKIHLNNNSAYETEEQLSYAMSHELGHHEWTKLTKEERDYVRSLPLETGMAKHYEAQEKSGKGKETSASLQEENFADYVMQYFQGKLYGDEALLNKIPTKLRELFDNKYSDLLKDNEHTEASEAYHTAKADGSNPELVKAVESLLSNEQTPAASSDVEQFNRAKEVSLKRIKNSNDPQKIFSEINRLQETLKKSQSFVLTPEEQTLIDEKLKELKDKGYSLKTKKGEILREGENVRVDDNVTLLKASDVTEVEKSLLEKELNRRNSLKQELIKNGYSEQEATIEAGLSPEKNIDIVSQDIEVAVIKNGVQEKSGKVAIRVISIEAVESLLSKEQAPIEIDESTPFDLSIALQTKKEEQDAIQKQSTTEEVLLNERPEMGLQEVGEGNAQVEAVAEQGSQEEKIEVAPLSFTPKNFIEELIGVEGAVALSGINEQQRQELIKDRLRTTTLTPQKEKEREIVKLVKSHNGMRRNARERLDVRGRIMRLVNDYNKEYPNQKLTFKSWYGDVKVTRPSFDRKQKSTYQKDLTVANLDVSNASLDETEKTFSERSDEFQRKFIELMDLGVQFEFRDAGNKKFSQKMLDDAMNDLDNGIPSRRAAVILNTVEKAIEENVITVGGSLTEGFQYIPLNLAIEETKEMKYEDELRNLSNAEIVAIYENEILAQKELDNIIQQEYETEFESDPNDEFGNVRQLAPRKKRDIINPNQEGDNQGQTSEGTIEENQNVENETPKTTANREAGENLVGGNQADIPTNADGNGQREEEITENTPKQGEEGVGVVTGAPTPVISEMDRAVLDAMKPTFEIEFIPNAKFLNTSAPLENKSSQDAVKRRYQTIKKLLECL